MNYQRYYSGIDRTLAQTFRLIITAHLLPNEEVLYHQTLNVRARDPYEALEISLLIRDNKLNHLYTSTAVSDLSGKLQFVGSSGPVKIDTVNEQEFGLYKYQVTIVREGGNDPVTGRWCDYAEDHLNIHALNEQQVHQLANFISGLLFYGQVRKTFINGMLHLDQNY